MDRSSEGALPWDPTFWAKADSWRRKWKNGDKKQGEAFLGSSTVFVFVTDGWHLAQFFFLSAVTAAIVFYKPICPYPLADFLMYRVALNVFFELFYSKVFK